MASAKIIYYPDTDPGISRRRRGRGFSFIAPDGTTIDNPLERARLKALAVTPAYEDAWLSPKPNGHLLFSGRDAKQRKQYRYHPDWVAERDRAKYDNQMQLFEALPGLRRWISSKLATDVVSRELMVAAALALIDRAALRPGSKIYAEQNGSFGATTLRDRHVSIDGTICALRFTAKGGLPVQAVLHGKRLSETLHALADLPGPELFSVPSIGTLRSEDLQEHLQKLCGPDISPKDLRTWQGTLAAFRVARAVSHHKLTISKMARAAAKKLHNTPTIARSSYIHPDVIGLAQDVPLRDFERMQQLRDDGPAELRQDEQALGTFLER